MKICEWKITKSSPNRGILITGCQERFELTEIDRTLASANKSKCPRCNREISIILTDLNPTSQRLVN